MASILLDFNLFCDIMYDSLFLILQIGSVLIGVLLFVSSLLLFCTDLDSVSLGKYM